jgi:hypothetical protein
VRRNRKAWVPYDTSHVTENDLHWAAGFLEGEGHFTFRESHGKSLIVVADQVQKEPLEKLFSLFGGYLWGLEATCKTPNAQYRWRWQAHPKDAHSIMEALYPLMSTRRKEQIDKAVERWIETGTVLGRDVETGRFVSVPHIRAVPSVRQQSEEKREA